MVLEVIRIPASEAMIELYKKYSSDDTMTKKEYREEFWKTDLGIQITNLCKTINRKIECCTLEQKTTDHHLCVYVVLQQP